MNEKPTRTNVRTRGDARGRGRGRGRGDNRDSFRGGDSSRGRDSFRGGNSSRGRDSFRGGNGSRGRDSFRGGNGSRGRSSSGGDNGRGRGGFRGRGENNGRGNDRYGGRDRGSFRGRGENNGRGNDRYGGRDRGRGGSRPTPYERPSAPQSTPHNVQHEDNEGQSFTDLRRRMAKYAGLLAKTDIDGVVRDDVGRKYKAVRLRLEAKDISSTERENAEKARTRRFYDKVKVERRMKRTQKLLKECPEDDAAKREELEKELHEDQINLNYAQYFPNLLEYVPLNPNLPISKDLEELRAAILEEIREATATDTLESLKEKRRQERLNKAQDEVAKKLDTLTARQKKHQSKTDKDDFFE